MNAALLGILARAAVELAPIGIYGMTCTVTPPTREVDIGMAPGAQRPAVLGLVCQHVCDGVGMGSDPRAR